MNPTNRSMRQADFVAFLSTWLLTQVIDPKPFEKITQKLLDKAKPIVHLFVNLQGIIVPSLTVAATDAFASQPAALATLARFRDALHTELAARFKFINFIPPLDHYHPTQILVVERSQDFANERTDNRRSQSYLAVSHSEILELEFHEGCNPSEQTNGFLTEDLLAILAHRLRHHQDGPFASRENALAAAAAEQAALWLYARRHARKAAGTSGTQTP